MINIDDVIRDGGLRIDDVYDSELVFIPATRLGFNGNLLGTIFDDPDSDFIDAFRIGSCTIAWQKSKGDWMAYG